MKPKDCFGIVVRTIGLFLILFSLFYFYGAVAASISPELGRGGTFSYYAGIGVIMLLVGLYMLRGASHLIQFAYGFDKENSESKHDDA